MGTGTNFSCTGTGGFVADAAFARTFSVGQAGPSNNAGIGPNLTFTGSGTAAQTVSAYLNTLDFGTTAFTAPAGSGVVLNNLFLSSDSTYTNMGVTVIGTGTLDCKGKTISFLTVNHKVSSPGTTTLASSLSTTVNATTTLSSGTLDLAGFTLTTGIFNSNPNPLYARSIAFGSGNIILTHTTAATTVLNVPTATNFTWTGTGGFVSDASVARTFDFGRELGGSATNAPNLTFTSGNSVQTFNTGSWFNKLDFGTTAFNPGTTALNLNGLTLSATGTYSALTPTMRGTGTVTGNGNATLLALIIDTTSGTTTLGSALTLVTSATTRLTSGTLDLAGFTLTTGIFFGDGTTTRSIAFGTGNIALVHPTAATVVLNMPTATGFTWTGTGGFTASAAVTRTYNSGSTSGGSITNAVNLTLTGSGTAVQTFIASSWFNKLDFGTTAFTVAANAFNLNGLTLSSGGTFTAMPVTMRGTGTITPNGKTVGALVINNSAGTTTLAGALSCTTYTHTSGTIDFATFNLTCSGSATYTAGTLNNIGTISCTTFRVDSSLTLTTGSITCSSLFTSTNTFTYNSSGTISCTTFNVSSGTFNLNSGTINCTSFTVSSGTFNLNSGTVTPSTSFVLTSGAFNYNGGTLSAVPTFTHTAGTVTLGQSYALSATGTYNLNGGTLNLNGFNLTTGIFSSTGSTARSVAFGTNNIILAHTTAATTVLSMATATNFTWTGTGGFTTNASVTRTFSFGSTSGGTVTNAPNLSITSGSATLTFTDGSCFDILNFTGTTSTAAMNTVSNGIRVKTLTLATGGTYTGFIPVFIRTQTWTSQFSKQLGGIGVGEVGVTLTLDNTQTYTATSTCYLRAGTLDLGGFDQTFGLISSSNSITRSIAFGSNNIILAHTSAGTTVLSMANAQNFSLTGTGGFRAAADITRTFNFGSGFGNSTNSPNLTFTGSGTAVATFSNGSYFNKLDFGTTSFTVAGNPVNLNSLTLSSGGTYTSVPITMVGTGTITPNGKTVANFTINHTGTTTLAAAFGTTVTSSVTLNGGTLDLAGFTLTTGIFSSSPAGSPTPTRSVAFGTGNIVLVHTTAGTTVLNVPTATNFTWTGTGGFTTNASITRTFSFGSTEGGDSSNAPNLSITSGAAAPTLTLNCSFKILDFTGSTCSPVSTGAGWIKVDTLILATGGTYTGLIPRFTRTQTWTSQYGKMLGGIGVFITEGGTLTLDGTQTFTATSSFVHGWGTLDLGGYDLTIGTYLGSSTVTKSIAFGSNNIILSTTTAAALNIDMAIATGFTWTGTGGFRAAADITRTFTFGTTDGSSANAPNLTLTGSGTAVQTLTTGSWFNNLDFGNTQFTVPSTNLNSNSLTLSSVCTYTSMTATMRSTGTVITNGNTTLGAMVIDSTSGTTSLGAAVTLTATGTFTLTSGALDLAGFTLTTGIFSSSGTTTRSIAFGSSNIVLAHTTASQTVLSMADATNFTWTGTGGFTASAAVIRTFTFGTTGGLSTNAPNVTLTTGSAILVFTTGGWFNILDFGTTSFTIGTTTLNLNSLVCSSTGTYTNLTATMVGTGTITTNGKTIFTLNVNCPGGTTTLAGALTTGVIRTTTLTSGTLDLAGFTLTTGIFSASNTNTRSVVFGSSNIVLVNTNAGTVLTIENATNFTWTGTGGFISDASVARTFNFGSTGTTGSSTNAPNLSITSGSAVSSFINGSWFRVLDFTGTTNTPNMTGGTTIGFHVDTLTLATGGTYTSLIPIFTRTQTWTAQFSKQLGGIGVNGDGVTLTLEGTQTYTATSTCFLTAGTLNLGGFDQTFGIFSSSNSNTRSVAFGSNNISLVHTTASTTVLAMSTATGFTWTGTGGFVAQTNVAKIFQFGNTAGGSITNAPNLTITSGGNVATLTTGSWFNTLDFGTSTFTPGSVITNLNSLKLSSTGTYPSFRPTMRGTGTINNNGNTTLEDIFIDNVSGTTSLAAAFSMTDTGATFTLTSGTLALNGFNLTCPVFSSTNTNTRSVAFGSNNIVLVAATSGSDTIDMGTATNFTWTGTGGFVTEPNVGRTRDFNFGSVAGGSSTNAPNLTISGAGNFFASSDFTTNSWFNILDLGICSGGQGTTTIINLNSLILSPNATYNNLFVVMVGTGVITPNGISIKQLTVNCPGGTTTLTGSLVTGFGSPSSIATLSAGTLNLNGFNLTAGTFSSSNSNTRSIAFGSGNIILTNAAVGETVLNMADATDFTFTGTGGFTTAMSVTRTFSFGSTTGGTATNAPNLSLTSGASVPTFTTGSWFKSLNFTGSTSTPATTRINVDTLTLATGGTYTALTPVFTRTQTWTPQFSKQLDGIGVGATGVTLTLEGTQTYTTTADLYVNAGTLNLNSTDQTFDYFISTGTGSRSITGGGSITVKNDWTVTSGSGFTGSDYAIKMNKSTAKTFAGAGGTYGTLIQNGAGDLTVTGSNSFADIQVI
jgi:hypothetical protein